jgi:heptaprenyl diphosphate synthase
MQNEESKQESACKKLRTDSIVNVQSDAPAKPKSAGKQKRHELTPAARVAYIAILIALAMILSYVEALIPLNFGVPGIKLGLANLVILIGLVFLRPGEVIVISVARILLTGFLFGNAASIIYSLAGGVLSFLVMLLLLKLTRLSIMGVSIAGGISHNIGQIFVAILVVDNIKLMYYLPALMVAGLLTGLLIGVLASRLLPTIQKISFR